MAKLLLDVVVMFIKINFILKNPGIHTGGQFLCMFMTTLMTYAFTSKHVLLIIITELP